MKHLWRTIAIIMMVVYCLYGIVMSIVNAATLHSFLIFLERFIKTLSVTAVWGLLIEIGKNIEDWLEKIFRNNAGLEQLPDSPDFITAGINKIANAANTSNTANMQQPYPQQPMQQPYNQSPMGQPVNNFQSAPMQQLAPISQSVPMQQTTPVAQPAPAPAPVPQSVPIQQTVPVTQPAPAPIPQPVPAPAAQPETWTCSCGTVNSSQANFCKGCGKPRS